MPPQWPDGGNGLMAPCKGLAPYHAFGSVAPCGYRGKFSAGVKGLHSAGRERRTQRIGLFCHLGANTNAAALIHAAAFGGDSGESTSEGAPRTPSP